MADKEIKLMAGGATIRLAGGNIYIHAPGQVEIKGTQHSFQGPASENVAAQLPVTEACAQKFASASQAGAAIVD
jgi:type VI secretion system secreted protein VgrG